MFIGFLVPGQFQYCIDEKYSKTLGQTHLVKLVLIFCGHRLVYHGEVGG
jgi:hypothetical protein